MRLPSTIRFADDDIKKAFYRLEKGDSSENSLFKSINLALDKLEKDAFSGIQLQKELIPKEYLKKYTIGNLWKYNLPGGWRLIYSIANDQVVVISLVIEWLDHKRYEKRFGY